MSSDELSPDLDLYAFLGVSVNATVQEIQSAYRKKSLLYHPDKNPDPSAAHTFHQLTLALNVLIDPKARTAYDNVRKAKAAKAERTSKYNEERRRMQLDLEARERDAKRRRFDTGVVAHDASEEERIFKRELQRLKEESERKKYERDKKMLQRVAQEKRTGAQDEVDRTVKVRFRKGVDRESLTVDTIKKIFSQHGVVEHVILGKNALVVFETSAEANAAVEQVLKSGNPAASIIKEVTFAQKHSVDDGPHKKHSEENDEVREPTTSAKPPATSTAPRFSFKPPMGVSNGADYESITLLRMRKIERERLEKEIREHEKEEKDELTVS